MRGPTLRGALVIVAAAGGGALTPAIAAGATLSVDRACYVDIGTKKAEPMVITGSGYEPGDQVSISDAAGGGVFTTVTADANGNISTTIAAPNFFFSSPGEKSDTLSAQDFTDSGTTISATTPPFLVAPLLVATKPAQARLTQKVTWYFSGFTPGATIYGHYLHGKHNRQVARTHFGKAAGPCGVLKVRARFYPGGHPRYSKYLLQVDDSRHYIGKKASPSVRVGIYKTLIPL